MVQRGSAVKDFSWINFHYVYGKEKAFLPEDAVNAPRNVEDATKCCNAGTRDKLGPGQRNGESKGLAEGMVNQVVLMQTTFHLIRKVDTFASFKARSPSACIYSPGN